MSDDRELNEDLPTTQEEADSVKGGTAAVGGGVVPGAAGDGSNVEDPYTTKTPPIVPQGDPES